jgi:hypothetical protein
MEREIRSAKREKVAYKTAVEESSGELKAAMQKALDYSNSLVRDKQAKIRDFINQTGQQRDYFREQNYGRVSYSNGLTSTNSNGKIKTGGKITDKNFYKIDYYEEQAKKFYKKCLQDNSDVDKISNNTGFSRQNIEKIKKHIMIKEHRFEDGTVRKFDVNIDQALAWQRLIEGTDIRDSDILLLNHELRELEYMATTNCVYEVAHAYSNEKYNWQKVIDAIVDNDNLKL